MNIHTVNKEEQEDDEIVGLKVAKVAKEAALHRPNTLRHIELVPTKEFTYPWPHIAQTLVTKLTKTIHAQVCPKVGEERLVRKSGGGRIEGGRMVWMLVR